MFEENGPFRPTEEGNITAFPAAWNLAANVLYVESPAYVGFSYWPGHGAKTTYNDQITADGNYEFLQKWIALYGDLYKNRPFVIAGESYAGILFFVLFCFVLFCFVLFCCFVLKFVCFKMKQVISPKPPKRSLHP